MKDKIIHIVVDSIPQSSSSWIDILSSSLTPVIALMALFIAFQQYKTNKQRLRNELYEKRLAIYQVIKMHLSKIAREGVINIQDCLKFYHDASEADFLFGKSITDKIEEIFNKSNELSLNVDILNNVNAYTGEEVKNAAAKKSDLMVWHFNQLEIVKEEFSKQMGIKVT